MKDFSKYPYLIFLLFLFGSTASAQEDPYYFYRPLDYGTERIYNPLSMIIDGGFGILQYQNRPRTFLDVNYKNGFHNVIENLSHPFYSIRVYGWKDFLENEVYPGSLQKKNAQYWPNYQNHLIGGGMSYIHVMEWYRYHEYPQPRLLALSTIAVYHFLNEIVENNAYDGVNVDPIADLYIFDPLSIVLFSINGVPHFFGQTLHMMDWSTQPCYSLNSRMIENQGQNFSIKVGLPFTDRVSLFYYWGLTGLIGLSYETDSKEHFSAGAGLRAKELVDSDDKTDARKLTAQLTWNAGFFYDREHSLLASLFLFGISDYKVHLNIYPGIVRLGSVSPGFFCAIGEEGKFVSGISFNISPLGAAARWY